MIKILGLTRSEAISRFDAYVENIGLLDKVDELLNEDYKQLRKELLKIEKDSIQTDIYQTDLTFAIKLYEYLGNCEWFNVTVANDYDFWRYLSINVVPDIIMRRCDGLNAPYFYEKTTRMYIPKMWWYIHMSYQGDLVTTQKILTKLSTDYILQLVERTGRNGFFLEVSREIMRQLSLLPIEILNHKENGANLFRRVLIQNTAKMDNYNLVAENDVGQYVHDLFLSCKVEVNEYERN